MFNGTREELGVLQSESKTLQREHCRIIEALDPRDGEVWDLAISQEKVNYTQSQGLHKVQELTLNVVPGLLDPLFVFQGIRTSDVNEPDDDTDDWLCYVSKPTHRFISPEVMVTWPNDQALLTFVTQSRVCYLWYSVKIGSNDLPEDWHTRFAFCVWPEDNGLQLS